MDNYGLIGAPQEQTRNESIAVGVASVEIAPNRTAQNPRKAIVVRNISDDPTKIISINQGYGAAVVNRGVVLKQYESYTDSTETGYECYQGTIKAICAVAAGALAIFER